MNDDENIPDALDPRIREPRRPGDVLTPEQIAQRAVAWEAELAEQRKRAANRAIEQVANGEAGERAGRKHRGGNSRGAKSKTPKRSYKSKLCGVCNLERGHACDCGKTAPKPDDRRKTSLVKPDGYDLLKRGEATAVLRAYCEQKKKDPTFTPSKILDEQKPA